MRLSSLVPHVLSYEVLTAPPRLVPRTQGTPSIDRLIHPIDATSLERVERARPGYASRAQRYLDAGHFGFAVCVGGEIAAMAWARPNEESVSQRVEYFPLKAGHVWLHADWTHESHRGNGYHKCLIRHRANYATAHWPNSHLTANIAKDNRTSLRNYEQLGFKITGTLTTIRWLRHDFGGSIR